MRHLFIFLVPLLLAFGGCAKTGVSEEMPAPGGMTQEQVQGIIISSLDTATAIGPLWEGVYAFQKNTVGCAAMATVGAVAPVLSSTLEQVYADQPATQFPAVAGDASLCGLPDITVLDEATLQVYLDAGFGTFNSAVIQFAPQLQAFDCQAWAVTVAAGKYAEGLTPALILLPQNGWKINEPARDIDYSACSAPVAE